MFTPMFTPADMEALDRHYGHKVGSLPQWAVDELREKLRIEDLVRKLHQELERHKALAAASVKLAQVARDLSAIPDADVGDVYCPSCGNWAEWRPESDWHAEACQLKEAIAGYHAALEKL